MQDSQNLERVVLSFDKFDIPEGKQIHKYVFENFQESAKQSATFLLHKVRAANNVSYFTSFLKKLCYQNYLLWNVIE